MSQEIIVRPPPGATKLPDVRDWTNRFEIHSASSDRVYVVAQNKDSGKWGCSCPGFKIHRKCKHLIDGCGIPESQIHGRAQMEYKKREGLQ